MSEISVLDHGYVKFIESWGSDEGIIEAARMSTNKGFLGWGPKCPNDSGHPVRPMVLFEGHMCNVCEVEAKSGDEKLLKFLYENKHMSPFEQAGLTIEVQAPIFVFREWHRHRTQSYNEMSARYTPLPDVNYIPSVERLLINSKSNKQAGTVQGAQELTEYSAALTQKTIRDIYVDLEDHYQAFLTAGVPKELARVILPVGRYSRMRASANLRNWLQFLELRMAPNAQWEIRQYANAVASLVAERFPRTYRLFTAKE